MGNKISGGVGLGLGLAFSEHIYAGRHRRRYDRLQQSGLNECARLGVPMYLRSKIRKQISKREAG